MRDLFYIIVYNYKLTQLHNITYLDVGRLDTDCIK